MKTENKQSEPFEDILVKYLAGSASEDEREVILHWIHENPDHQKYFDELKSYYLLTKVIQKPSGFNKDESWKKIQASYYKKRYLSEQEQRKRGHRKTILYAVISSAAAVLIAFFLGYSAHRGSWIKQTASPQAQNEILVPLGAKSHITLADGTKVWLNAGSKLKYPDGFSRDSREVYLEGEAFFDVKENNKRMFVVKTSNLDIKVYGTQFNVKSYPEENLIQTTLVKGSVAIETYSDNTQKKAVFLKPNQTAIFYKSTPAVQNIEIPDDRNNQEIAVESGEKIVISPLVNAVPITSWKDNRWIIISEELEDLAIKLERRYNVKISFANESLKKYKFSGTLKDETFEQVLQVIQLSAPITYQIDGNEVLFKEDPLYKKKYDKMISNNR
jgi:transmembrane sensor